MISIELVGGYVRFKPWPPICWTVTSAGLVYVIGIRSPPRKYVPRERNNFRRGTGRAIEKYCSRVRHDVSSDVRTVQLVINSYLRF